MLDIALISSGMSFPGLIGALIRLHEDGYEFNSVTGISSGALVSGMLATGYKVNEELTRISKKLLPSKAGLVSYSSLYMFFMGYMNSGKAFEDELSKHLINHMEEAHIPTSIPLVENNSDLKIVDYRDGELGFASIVRAAMSAPMLMPPKKIKGKLYTDPLLKGFKFYEKEIQNVDLAIKVVCKNAPALKKQRKSLTHLSDMYSTISAEHIDLDSDKCIFVEIPYSPLNLSMLDIDVDKMIMAGYEAAEKWLKRSK